MGPLMKPEAAPDPETSLCQLDSVAPRHFDADCLSISAEMIEEWRKMNHTINEAWFALDWVVPEVSKCGLTLQQPEAEADSTAPPFTL
jgi:hypothetical protein